ncbi:hypothetical protein BDR07DRAFT_1614088 [Suillus spraguei]|nr:hypothetical protein BDR07DRAFT_1614088 [Suillus spraguei]
MIHDVPYTPRSHCGHQARDPYIHSVLGVLSLLMPASSTPTEQAWNPCSLLAYDAFPHRQDFGPIIISDTRSTVKSNRFLLPSGVTVINVVSIEPIDNATITQLDLQMEILTLILNLIVTLCTEPIGFSHASISLRSALATESRLNFNTSLRLLAAAHRYHNAIGALLNGIMAVRIVSYTSSSVVLGYDSALASDGPNITVSIAVAGLPLLSLGVGSSR